MSVLIDEEWVTINLGNPLHAKLFKDAYDRQQGASGGVGSSTSRSGGKRLSMQVMRRAPQAVVKVVRNGGTTSARGMRDQMAYLEKDGEVRLERSERYFGAELDGEDKEGFVDAWEQQGQNRSRSDKTTHFVVSFPSNTDHDAAYRAGRAWAEELFATGNYGDVFDYYTAFHTDKDHPHMHVVVSRRGLHEDSWLKVSKRSAFNYDRLRAVQVEVAAQEGIVLEASPRLARGVTERTPTDEEMRRAEKERRKPVAPSHTIESAILAAASIAIYTNQFMADAKLLRSRFPDLANSLEDIAESILHGNIVHNGNGSGAAREHERLQSAEHDIVSKREDLLENLGKIRDELRALPNLEESDELKTEFDAMLKDMSNLLPEVWASRGFLPLMPEAGQSREQAGRESKSQKLSRSRAKDHDLDID